jgi:hypothetical protein
LYDTLFANLSAASSISALLLLFETALLAAHTGTHKLCLRSAQLGLFVCAVCRAWRCGCTPTSPVGVTSNKSLLCRLMNRTTSPTLAEPHPSHIISSNPRKIHPFAVVRCHPPHPELSALYYRSFMKTLCFILISVHPLVPLTLYNLRWRYLMFQNLTSACYHVVT